MAFYVYILRCADGSYYPGQTYSLESRIATHQRGEVPGYTRMRRPVQLVYAEGFYSRREALASERQIKGWRRAKKEALMKRDWERLIELSHTYRSATVWPDRGEPVEP